MRRREVLLGGAAALAVLPGTARGTAEPSHRLVAAERRTRIIDAPSTVWSYGDTLFPIVRARVGEPFRAVLENRLAEHSSIHWHGVRVPNAMDGVPYLTQPPVEPGQRFTYEFTPSDTGTTFFHPHCDTVQQLGRGLVGVLIVEGDAVDRYDADIVAVLKDWRVAEDGAWLPFLTDEGAGKAGTFGTVRTINGARTPRLEVPAYGLIRLRVLNVDPTRVSEVGLTGAGAAVIATDGNPLGPLPLESWRLGPAMRLDLAVAAPGPGEEAVLVDYFAPEPVELARLVGVGAGARRPFEPKALAPSGVPKPDLAEAQRQRFTFSASAAPSDLVLPGGEVLRYADELCLSGRTRWAINQATWPMASHERLPPPLATFERGRSYVMELVNVTPHQHPVHIHGHTWHVLRSSKREIVPHLADTVLLAPRERLEVAFVADNPGDWMLHCHVIEHQETGMMGIVRVA